MTWWIRLGQTFVLFVRLRWFTTKTLKVILLNIISTHGRIIFALGKIIFICWRHVGALSIMVTLRDCLSTQNVLRKFWSQFAGCRRLILSNVKIAYHSAKLSLKAMFSLQSGYRSYYFVGPLDLPRVRKCCPYFDLCPKLETTRRISHRCLD